jgi:hypothetical protein
MKNRVREELVVFGIENLQTLQDFLEISLFGGFGEFLFLFLIDSLAKNRTSSKMMVIDCG